MLMNRTAQVDSDKEEKILLHDANSLSAETFKPLSQRLGKEFSKGMQNLKRTLLASDFEDYIENIVSLKIVDGSLWLVTNSPMHRSLLEHRFIPIFKEAFDVDKVRIISQT